MELDLSGFRKIEVLLTVFSTVAALVYGYLLLKFRTEFAPLSGIAAANVRLDSVEARVRTLEGAINHLPTREDTHTLALALSDLRGDVRSVGARLEGMEKLMGAVGRKVELIDEHLQGRAR